MNRKLPASDNQPLEMVTFFLGKILYGIDIVNVQGINKLLDITPVSQAPEYVKGLLNLRGQIITIIDLGKKLGLSSVETNKGSRGIIVKSGSELVGLQVDRISDIIYVDQNDIEKPPSNIGAVRSAYFRGVYKGKDDLIGILNIEKILQTPEESQAVLDTNRSEKNATPRT